MPSYILLIYEGEVAEKQISNSIQEHFFTDNSSEFLMIEASHCGEIYSLYNKMAKDSYIDLFLIKEIPKIPHYMTLNTKTFLRYSYFLITMGMHLQRAI